MTGKYISFENWVDEYFSNSSVDQDILKAAYKALTGIDPIESDVS